MGIQVLIIDYLPLHRPTKRRKLDDPQHQTFLNIHSGQLLSIPKGVRCVVGTTSNYAVFLLCKTQKQCCCFH